MTFRERAEWLGRMALMGFILASVAFLSALIAMRFAIQGRQVVVPDVTGRISSEAGNILRNRGIGLKIEDRVYSSLPLDAVVRQSPPSGTTVKIGQYEHVVVSLGPQRVTIPALTDLSLRAARIELLRDGMQLGEVSSAHLPLPGPDQVIQQDPAAGETGATGPRVDLLVSLGQRPPAYVMPDLEGLPLAEAERRLQAAGFKVARIRIEAAAAPHGTVAGQTPAHGQKLDSASQIELQVTP